MSGRTVKVAVAQSHTRPSTADTLKVLQQLTESAADQSAHFILFPEAYLGGYPRSLDFGSSIGARTDEGRDQFLKHYQFAIDLGDTPAGAGEEWVNRSLRVEQGAEYRGDGTREKLEGIAARTGVFLVVGVVERAGGTLYCSVVYVCPKLGCIGKRRKVMPTAAERTIWAQGTTSTLKAVTTKLNGVKTTLAAAICWENYMPLLRFSLYSQNVNLYLAPTADARDTWLPLLQTIASEGRCFVLSSNQCVRKRNLPHNFNPPTDEGEKHKVPQKPRRRSVITKTEENHEIQWPCLDREKNINGGAGNDNDTWSKARQPPVFHMPKMKPITFPNGTQDVSDKWACRGGSSIIAPTGAVLAGPIWEEEDAIITATIDFDDCIRGKLDFDVAGGYSRMDSFSLKVKDLDLNPPP